MMGTDSVNTRRKFGVVGGLGPLGSADVFFKMVKATPASSDDEHVEAIFEQYPFNGAGRAVPRPSNASCTCST